MRRWDGCCACNSMYFKLLRELCRLGKGGIGNLGGKGREGKLGVQGCPLLPPHPTVAVAVSKMGISATGDGVRVTEDRLPLP